jgi:hypothetical protein
MVQIRRALALLKEADTSRQGAKNAKGRKRELNLSVFRETRDDFPERRWGLTAKDAEVAKIT